MDLIYIVSQYPSLTETFIAREIEQLEKMGYGITIFALRPPFMASFPSGLMVPRARTWRVPLNLGALLLAQMWLWLRNPAVWWSCWKDILLTSSKVLRLHHLIHIMLATTWLARRLRNDRVDHIRAHYLHSEVISSMWLSRIVKVPYSLTAHTVETHYPRSLITKMAREAAFVVGDTQEVYDFLSKLQPRAVHLIHNGINIEDFTPRTSEPGIPQILLAVGTLIGKKGFDVLIQACGLLQQRGIPFVCRIIGEGRERLRLETLVRQLSLNSNIQLPGSMTLKELLAEYAAATILVMPSKDTPIESDGLPTVLIESMALGIPVVATRKAGIPDLVKDGETGLLAEPNDPESLAASITRLLSDCDLQHRLSRAGRRFVEKEYDIRNSVSKLSTLMVYNSLH